jgi:hypothetical protein
VDQECIRLGAGEGQGWHRKGLGVGWSRDGNRNGSEVEQIKDGDGAEMDSVRSRDA